MNIKKLKEAIKDLPDEMEVILQKDAEGNDYSPVQGADSNAIYIPESTWYGEVYSPDWSAGDALMDEEEWEELLKEPRVLILYPVN